VSAKRPGNEEMAWKGHGCSLLAIRLKDGPIAPVKRGAVSACFWKIEQTWVALP
jgi:hypothetical protein